MFGQPADPVRFGWGLLFLAPTVAIDEKFNFSVDKFKKERLRTGPATPNPSKYYREEHDGNDRNGHHQREDVGIFREDHHAEEIESSVEEIEQHKGMAVDFQEWGDEKKQQQRISYDAPSQVPFAFGLLGFDPSALTEFIDVVWPVPKILIACFFHLHSTPCGAFAFEGFDPTREPRI